MNLFLAFMTKSLEGICSIGLKEFDHFWWRPLKAADESGIGRMKALAFKPRSYSYLLRTNATHFSMKKKYFPV